MIKIGLTGGICSGKTLVLSFFKQLGAYTVKADELSKNILFGDDLELRRQIFMAIGLDPKKVHDPLSPKQLADVLFSNPEKRLLVNGIVHPRVKDERNKLVAELEKSKKQQLFFYESALLAEAGTYRDFDRILVVYCNPDIQLERLMIRDNINKSEAEKKIRSQLPLSEKLKIAHYTIDTSGSIDKTYALTLETYSLILRDFNLSSNLVQ